MKDPKILRLAGRPIAAPGNDIDTDRIMPARYLRCVTFESIGQYTFQDERFDPAGKPKAHPFNDPRHKGASILVVNKNFGCGSSREHAPQGLLRWGIQAIVGESFAEIFAGNCAAIGLPAVTAPPAEVKALAAYSEAHPDGEVVVDLEQRRVTFDGKTVPVEIKESARNNFLEGTWDTASTLLAAQDQIRATAGKLPYLSWSRP